MEGCCPADSLEEEVSAPPGARASGAPGGSVAVAGRRKRRYEGALFYGGIWKHLERFGLMPVITRFCLPSLPV
jgi:hypothetical protein